MDSGHSVSGASQSSSIKSLKFGSLRPKLPSTKGIFGSSSKKNHHISSNGRSVSHITAPTEELLAQHDILNSSTAPPSSRSTASMSSLSEDETVAGAVSLDDRRLSAARARQNEMAPSITDETQSEFIDSKKPKKKMFRKFRKECARRRRLFMGTPKPKDLNSVPPPILRAAAERVENGLDLEENLTDRADEAALKTLSEGSKETSKSGSGLSALFRKAPKTKKEKAKGLEGKKAQTKKNIKEISKKQFTVLRDTVKKIKIGNPFSRAMEVLRTYNGDPKEIGETAHRFVKAFQETDEGRLIVIGIVALSIFNLWFFMFGVSGLVLGGISLFAGYYLSDTIDKVIGTALPMCIKLDRLDNKQLKEKRRLAEIKRKEELDKLGIKEVPLHTRLWRKARGKSPLNKGEVIQGHKADNTPMPAVENTIDKMERLARTALIITAVGCFIFPLVGVVGGYALRHRPMS